MASPNPAPRATARAVPAPSATARPVPTPTSTARPAPTRTATRSPTPTQTATGPVKNLIAWILSLGPGSPTGPAESVPYERVRQTQCDAVSKRLGELDAAAARLYGGAASACLAAFQNRQELWTDAERAYASIAPSGLSCFDIVAYGLLKRLVVAHQVNPEGEFEVTMANAESPPCPTISRLDPVRGPRGSTVTVTGSNFRYVDEVRIHYGDGSSERATLAQRDESSLIFKVPGGTELGATRTVCIALHTRPRIEGGRKWGAAGRLFTLEAPDTPATAPPPGFACPPNPT